MEMHAWRRTSGYLTQAAWRNNSGWILEGKLEPARDVTAATGLPAHLLDLDTKAAKGFDLHSEMSSTEEAVTH